MLQSEPIVKINNLSKSFGDKKVLDNINFSVYKDEILQVIGFSGTGKTTLLKLICSLEEPDSGEVLLKTTHMSMVFQGSALFDSMSVFENVAFPLLFGPVKLTYNTVKSKVLEKLRLVGLSGMENLRPDELSGGMKKRVSFARAIVNDPEIILYDEPTSGLDPVATNIIVDYISKLQSELKASSILVTHNLEVIQRIQSRILLLYDSKIVWEGTTGSLFSTDNPYAKQFREGAAQGPMLVIRE